MKIQLTLIALLIVSFFAAADADAVEFEKAPEDQPNFKPTVTPNIDEKNVEIVEFKCKFK
ncbi:MAG: hypothetical protein QXW37_02555 [Candidatus Nitrosotenuis sp.]